MIESLVSLFLGASEKNLLKKAVCSKPVDTMTQKTVLSPKQIGGKAVLQAESFRKDNKAVHENIPVTDAGHLQELLLGYGQINLFTTVGDCEYRVSKSGKAVLLGGDKLQKAIARSEGGIQNQAEANNREKERILSGSEPFLRRLDICDENGRIRDKRQSKFRQINRFLELIRDCLGHLPKEGTLRICDLCCGKSYLSFAAYHYFVNILGREVKMTGVDLKSDVVENCNRVAKDLHFDGLEFLCRDVSQYETGEKVHLVISLHACDIATDLVLASAVRWNADVILSTPCCHHELNHHFDCPSLAFIGDHSMLRQKFCDAATDALRLKYLESCGYSVAALELIDPDETPKNIMLRGLRNPNFNKNSEKAQQLKEEYLTARKFLTGGLDNVQQILFPSDGQ